DGARAHHSAQVRHPAIPSGVRSSAPHRPAHGVAASPQVSLGGGGSRIGVVVWAAGRSTRFASGASSKLLASVRGAPLVRHAVTAAVDADWGAGVVATGDRAGA